MAGMLGFAFGGAGLGSRLGAGAETGLTFSPQGQVAMAKGDALIRQSIMLLLTTRPGERVMRPDYGCPLHRLIFAPNDATTAGLAIHYVRQAIARWEKRIDIVRLDAGPDPQEPGALSIMLDYRVRETGSQQRMEMTFSLDGGMG